MGLKVIPMSIGVQLLAFAYHTGVPGFGAPPSTGMLGLLFFSTLPFFLLFSHLPHTTLVSA